MTAKTSSKTITRALRAELGAVGEDGAEPTSVRFLEVAALEDGAEPMLAAMVIVPLDEWRKAGAPLTAELTLKLA